MLIACFSAPSKLALADTFDAFAARIATTWASRLAACISGPFRCTMAHTLYTFTMFAALLWAYFFFTADASPLRITHTTRIIDTRSVVVAVLRAKLKRAICIRKSGVTLALSIQALSMVATLVRAGLDFACDSSKSTLTEARTIVAHSSASAIARAFGRGTIVTNETCITVAGQIDRTDTVARALLWAGLTTAIFTFIVIVTLADALVASSIVIALIGACLAAARSASKPLVAHTFTTITYTVSTTFVRAASKRGRTLFWARFLCAIFAFPTMSTFAVFVWGALSMARASFRADFDGACPASKTSIALARAVFHATTIEVAHFRTLRFTTIDATEQFSAFACTIFGIADAIV